MMKPTEQTQAQLDWMAGTAHAGNGVRYDMGIGDASKALYFRRDGLKSLAMDEIKHRMGFFKAANSVGVEAARRPLNIYITAAVAELQSWLLMDDLDLDQCHLVARDRTHMIVQTSPGSHHLWLATSRPVTVDERKICQQALQHRFGGDAGSVSGDHFGRLAGFKNVKRGCWVNLAATVITDRRADIDKLLSIAAEAGVGLALSIPQGGVVPSPVLIQGGAPQARSPSVISPPVSSVSSSFSPSGRDESRAEFAFACAQYQKHLDIEAGIQSLTQRALDRGKCKNFAAAEKYARKTFDVAALRHTSVITNR